MSKQVFPLWVFALAAMLIAVTALDVAQIAKGSGAVVVLALTAVWMTFVQVRSRKATHG